ncbi:MAG: hypothetical protein IPN38_03200 [Flavobacteriales bacterium]|nr:hypothetical protein [Flavobacteriales bacterium]
MRTLLTLLLTTLITFASAQTEVVMRSHKFSNGVQPTFSVNFPGADKASVEAWFERALKGISDEVRDKKEVIATGARIPAATGDTLAVFLAVEQRSKGDDAIVHLGFRIQNVFVNSDSEQRRIDGCKAWVYEQAVAYKKDLANKSLDEALKVKARLNSEMEMLVKEQKRAELSIERNTTRSAEAVTDKAKAEIDLKLADEDVRTHQASSTANPTDEEIKQLNAALKEQRKLQERIAKLTKEDADAQQKIVELKQALVKNATDQDAKTKAIAEQQVVVDTRRKVLDEVK